jgi:MULE transposase domain
VNVDVIEMDRTMRSDIRSTGKRPRDAFTETLTSIAKRFKSTVQQMAIVSQFPSYSGIRRQLYRHRDATHIPVPDPCDLPEELTTTHRGKNVTADDVNYLEQFLLHTSMDGKLLVFCADTELQTLYNSPYVVCDGTFEMAPDSAYQLYTIHGYYGDEGMPLVWALLPNKGKSTYVDMFQAIRYALVNKYGDVGGQRSFIVDFELAAIDAIATVFPQATVKGCTFHFRQALMRHVADEGLRPAYNANDPPVVRDWIRQLMGMTLLPVVFIPRAWESLRCPPVVTDPELHAKMVAFSGYFDWTWMTGSFAPQLWSHFDNIGPRTTNLAEGWHNQLNHSFGMPHPSPRNFLHWLQTCQYEVQCRQIQLAAGRPTKPRSRTYLELDAKIQQAKLMFSLRVGHIFSQVLVNPMVWDLLRDEISIYVRHAAYLIAGQS